MLIEWRTDKKYNIKIQTKPSNHLKRIGFQKENFMKISEVKHIIESLERLSKNLENLRALSTGAMAALPDKDKAREWSEKIADMASVDSSLPNIFQEAKNVTDNEINRLNELIDTTDVNP